MLRASSTSGDGRRLMLLGLTPENVRRLKDGEPILVDCAELGVDARLTIMFGQTERAIAAELRSHGVELPDGETAVRDAERVHREKGTTP